MSSASVWYFCRKIIPQKNLTAKPTDDLKSSKSKFIQSAINSAIDETYFTRMSNLFLMPFEN